MSSTRTMPPPDREAMRARLRAIPAELEKCWQEEKRIGARIQRLRDEQAELNAKVYRS